MIDEDDYYDSQEWADEREYALMDWDGLCEMCDEPTDSPHVHHTYGLKKQIYDIWCPECHAEHHGDPNIALYQKKQTCCKYCGDGVNSPANGYPMTLVVRNDIPVVEDFGSTMCERKVP